MKKILYFLAFSFLVGIFLNPAEATIHTGTWSIEYDSGSDSWVGDPGLLNGSFTETVVAPYYAPFQPGNLINAIASDSTQWRLENLSYDTVEPAFTGLPYYFDASLDVSGATATLDSAPSLWGDATIFDLTESYITDGYVLNEGEVEFTFHAKGVFDNYTLFFTAYFNSFDVGQGSLSPGPGTFDLTGETFDYVSVTIVPEPASMLILGSGLLGLAGFRKKIKK